MTVLYYEINDNLVHKYGSKYISEYIDDMRSPYYNLRMAFIADKIWKQDGDGITFIKHRDLDCRVAEVDMEEFMMVVLKSISL